MVGIIHLCHQGILRGSVQKHPRPAAPKRRLLTAKNPNKASGIERVLRRMIPRDVHPYLGLHIDLKLRSNMVRVVFE
jgi:hypothetical protein